eukprot:UN25809
MSVQTGISHGLQNEAFNHLLVDVLELRSNNRVVVRIQSNGEVKSLPRDKVTLLDAESFITIISDSCFYCSQDAPEFMRDKLFEITPSAKKSITLSAKKFKKKKWKETLVILIRHTAERRKFGAFLMIMEHLKSVFFENKDLQGISSK